MDAAQARRALATHGRRRTKAREQVATESAAIVALAPAALEAGLTKREICQLAQISRPTLDDFLRNDKKPAR